MVVAVSATGTATHNAASGTQNFTFTVNASDTLAVFFVAQNSASSNTVTSVTWDQGGTNQACTQVATQNCSAAADGSIGIYAVVSPTPGTKTLQVIQQLSQAMTAELQSYTGSVTSSVAAACTMAVTTQNSNANSSLPTITGTSGDMDIGAFVSNGTISSINHTQIWLSVTAQETAGANQASTGTSVTFTIAQGAGTINAGVGCNIVAAGAAGPVLNAKALVGL